MKFKFKLILFLTLIILISACSKSDDNSNSCLFEEGSWCAAVICVEFRSDKHFFLNGAYINDWRLKNINDCTKIELLNRFLGTLDSEINIKSISGNSSGSKMLMDFGGQEIEYIKN